MAIIGHVAIRLRLFPYEGMTVSDVIDHADEAMCRVNTQGFGLWLVLVPVTHSP